MKGKIRFSIFREMAIISLIFIGLSNCGYHFQGDKNPLKNLGVEKIYVKSFTNSTYRPGLEQFFTSAMILEIQRAGAFTVVNSVAQADAVLTGNVGDASKSISSIGSFKSNSTAQFDVAAQYNASVNCAVTLTDKLGRTIFSQSVAASKPFVGALPESVKFGDETSTIPTTNDSEQRIAIQNLASQLMGSVYQRMVDTF